jgi:ribonuclease P protein component
MLFKTRVVKFKFETLKSSSEFRNLYKKGKHIDTVYFKLIINVVDDFSNIVRIGYNINKKISKSTTRNLIKRRVREIFISLQKNNQIGLDVLFIAKKPVVSAGFSGLKDQIQGIMKGYLG